MLVAIGLGSRESTVPARMTNELARTLRSWLQHRARPAWTLLALSLAAAIASWSAVFRDDWPYNHEYLAAFQRVEWFRRAFAAGDFFPLWTRFCFDGHGSPGPLLYHRLFNTLGGALAHLTGSSELAVRAMVPALLVVGGVGMMRAGAALGWATPLRLWAGVVLMFAHYTLTDWMVRGAMAEFTAMMILPWYLGACIALAKGQRAGAWLGLSLTALFYAHTVIFLFSLPMAFIAIALGTRSAFAGRAARSSTSARSTGRVLFDIGVAGGILALLAGPYALAVAMLGSHFNLRALRVFLPQDYFAPVALYFVDDAFAWGRTWEGISFELSRGLVFSLAVAALARWRYRAPMPRTSAIFLAASAAPYVFLQLELAAPFYRHVPGLHLLQFPWRLLAMLTPLTILALGEWSGGLLKVRPALSRPTWAVLLIVLAFQMQFTVRSQNTHYARFSRDEIRAVLAQLDGPFNAAEFLPEGLSVRALPPRVRLFEIQGGTISAPLLAIRAREDAHISRVEILARCPTPCQVRSSQFFNPLLSFTTAGGKQALRAADGTMLLELPAGEHSITLRQRGLFESMRVSRAMTAPNQPARGISRPNGDTTS